MGNSRDLIQFHLSLFRDRDKGLSFGHPLEEAPVMVVFNTRTKYIVTVDTVVEQPSPLFTSGASIYFSVVLCQLAF